MSVLTDREYRAFLVLCGYVARYGNAGEFPPTCVRFVEYLSAGRRRRISQRTLERFLEFGLVELFEYVDDGLQVLEIAGWRDYQPIDGRSAERKRRFRQRLYGDAYRDGGELGKVAELDLSGR